MGKKVKNPYDPQIGAAAKENVALAKRAQAFTEEYYNKYVSPMIEEMISSSRKTQDRMDIMFDKNIEQMDTAMDRYKRYGMPAEDRYFDMASSYSEPGEYERQAGLALGDVRTAASNQNLQYMRSLSSMGIDPTSPAAMSALADTAVANTAMEASAKNRARGAARQLGMALTSDAANFGRGGQSGILQFGAAAGGNAMGGFGVAQGAAGGVNQGAAVPMSGYQAGMQAQQFNASLYQRMGSDAMSAQAQSSAGIGNFLGSALGMAAGIKWSDRRLKENIKPVGVLSNGLQLYAYNYIGASTTHIGVMADEVEQVIPEAVTVDSDGYKMVDYSLISEALGG